MTLAISAAGCTGSPEPSPAPSTSPDAAGERAIVAKVRDGDSIRLTDGRELRLLQIDAPELHGDCYGEAALRTLKRWIPAGAHIRIDSDRRLDQVDKYGRLLRYVFSGPRNVNVELVRVGAASPYFFRNDRGRYADDLLAAVAAARAGRAGFWRTCPDARLDTHIGSITGRS